MANETDQSAQELSHYVSISNLPYGISANRVVGYFERYGKVGTVHMKRRLSVKSSIFLANPRITLAFDNPESIDQIMAARPISIDDCELFIRRCLPLTKRYPSEAFHTVRKILVRTKMEKSNETLPDDETIVDYLSLSGGKIEYFERLSDTTVLVQFDDYDPVDVCCLGRPHFINDQEIEIEKCIDESVARDCAGAQQKSNPTANRDPSPADMDTVSPPPTLSIDDQISQLHAAYHDMTSQSEHDHEQLVASLSAEWERTARDRIRMQRLTLDAKQELERLVEDNKKQQKLFSESLQEKPRVQKDGDAKLCDAYQRMKTIEEKYEQLMQNNRQ